MEIHRREREFKLFLFWRGRGFWGKVFHPGRRNLESDTEFGVLWGHWAFLFG